MKLNKKATALLLGLTLGISGTAFAADGADSFSDVPQGHWARMTRSTISPKTA